MGGCGLLQKYHGHDRATVLWSVSRHCKGKARQMRGEAEAFRLKGMDGLMRCSMQSKWPRRIGIRSNHHACLSNKSCGPGIEQPVVRVVFLFRGLR